MIPTDPALTKLRILAERAKAKFTQWERNTLAARRDYEKAWVAYVQACRERGYCAFCEFPLADCSCVFLADAAASGPKEAG